MKKNLLFLLFLPILASAKLVQDPGVLIQEEVLSQNYDFNVKSHILQEGDNCVDSTDFAQCLRNQDNVSDLIFVYNEKLKKLDANTREDISVILPRTETFRLEQFAAPYISRGDYGSGFVAYLESVGESLQKICTKNKIENCTTETMQSALQKKYTRQGNILTWLNKSIYRLIGLLAIYLIYQAYFAKRKKK